MILVPGLVPHRKVYSCLFTSPKTNMTGWKTSMNEDVSPIKNDGNCVQAVMLECRVFGRVLCFFEFLVLLYIVALVAVLASNLLFLR